MAMIRVRTVQGRIARESPRGDFIPTDKFVRVTLTPYIRRLIEVHKDLEVEVPKVAAVKPTKAPAAPTPKE